MTLTVDTTLVFAMPVIAFTLQCVLVGYSKSWLLYSALTMGVTYFASSWLINKFLSSPLKLLSQAHVFLGLSFVTLACPLAFSGNWSTVIWAIEGLGILWIGLRQQRVLPQFIGCLLQIAASIHFILLLLLSPYFNPVDNLINYSFFSMIAYMSAYILNKEKKCHYLIQSLSSVLFIIGCFWLLIDIYHGINFLIKSSYHQMAWLTIVTLITILAYIIDHFFDWARILVVRYALTITMIGVLLFNLMAPNYGVTSMVLAWCFAFIVQYSILRRMDLSNKTENTSMHTLLIWLLMLVLAIIANNLCSHENLGAQWPVFLNGLIASVVLYALISFGYRKDCWPYSDCPVHYVKTVVAPLIILSALGVFYVSFSLIGGSQSEHFIPILNLTDITVIIVLSTLLYAAPCWLKFSQNHNPKPLFYGVWTGLVFIWLNSVILNTMHAWLNIPLTWNEIVNSPIIQLSLSTFYAIFSLITMIIATSKKWRYVWFIGFGLIIFTTVKLLLIDLANINTIERIITFIVTGFILLLIGYLSPLPPKSDVSKPSCQQRSS